MHQEAPHPHENQLGDLNPASLVGAVEHDVLALVDADVERGVAAQSRADEVEVAAALVPRPLREEGAVEVA